MNVIDNLTAEPTQLTRLLLGDGSEVDLTLTYRPAIERWTMDVVHAASLFSSYGMNVSANPNLLRGWKEVIPFGIGCSTDDGGDPAYLDDFTSGRVVLWLLSAADIGFVESLIGGA